MPHAHFQSRKRVGQRLPVGIVKVADDRVDMEVRERSLNRRLHPAWRAHTDGVGHAHLLNADIAHQTGHHGYTRRCDRTFIRTTHGARDRTTHRHTCCQRSSHHRPEALDALGNRAVDVLLAEGFAGRAKDDHGIGPCRQRGFKALHIRHQRGIAYTGQPGDAAHHLGVIRHLRHPLGADKTGDLNVFQPRRLQALHQLDLHGSRHGLLFVLQAVAGADVGDVNETRK